MSYIEPWPGEHLSGEPDESGVGRLAVQNRERAALLADSGQIEKRRGSGHGGDGSNCVEVGGSAPAVLVRDTKDREGAGLTFGSDAWRRFAADSNTHYSGDGPFGMTIVI